MFFDRNGIDGMTQNKNDIFKLVEGIENLNIRSISDYC
ncbi:hypothetical protein VRK_36320 [Vibrio sp. MEBiC08052]|nr:hypothetical protein VRK_36320 [Vibrio sp. MEBiC08052]